MDLTEYLAGVDEDEMRDAFVKVARGLRDLHGSGIDLESSEGRETALGVIGERLERVAARLAGAGDAPIARLRAALAEPPAEWRSTPIHGQMGWGCVLFDGGRFFLWRFERARLGHPGLDVGAFLADLLLSPFPVALAGAFTAAYFAELRAPWSNRMPFFVAVGVLERLDRRLERGDSPSDVVSTLERVGERTAEL